MLEMSKAVTRWWRELQVIPIQLQTGLEEDQFFARMLLGSEEMCDFSARRAASSVEILASEEV